jgi:hypothetical protein
MKKLLKKVLEALEASQEIIGSGYGDVGERNESVIEAVKIELAKPEPKPAAWLKTNEDGHTVTISETTLRISQPKWVKDLWIGSKPLYAAPISKGCIRCSTPAKCAIYGCSPNTWASELP